MHMEGPALTTTRTKKYKLKLTKAKRAELEMDMFHYNKKQKRMGQPKVSFDKYVDIRCGRPDPVSRKKHPSEQGEYNGPRYQAPIGRESKKIPSKPMGDSVATKKETTQYTGTLITGIATMHKSNAIPIIDKKQAQEVSKMRRG